MVIIGSSRDSNSRPFDLKPSALIFELPCFSPEMVTWNNFVIFGKKTNNKLWGMLAYKLKFVIFTPGVSSIK